MTHPAPPPGPHPLRAALAAAMACLVATDAVGGLWAVAADVNTWSSAWGSTALLAAPAPMIAAQVLFTAAAVLGRGRIAAACATALSLACLVSVASGFFDGGLGNPRLTEAMAWFQVALLGVTFVVGALAGLRARQLLRTPRPGTSPADVPGAAASGARS